MKIISYNINGLNAFSKETNNVSKLQQFMSDNLDNTEIICFQEVKMNDEEKLHKIFKEYENLEYSISVNNKKKGYAGVLTLYDDLFTNKSTEVVLTDINNDTVYTGGRIVVSEFSDFYLINVYVVNSGNKEEIRKEFDRKFKEYIQSLNKPVIICGDLNVCATELDYWGKYNKAINSAPGLMQFEIDGFNDLCASCNLIDAYRYKHPNDKKYSWYSTRNKNAIEKNQGWRLDYFLVSDSLKDKIIDCDIMQGYQAPDHSPIFIYMGV